MFALTNRRQVPRQRSARTNSRRVSSTLIVLAASLAFLTFMAACTDDDSQPALAGAEYNEAMSTLCGRTDERLAALPTPPEQISATDWATEVARAFSAEAESSAEFVVDSSVRELHRSYTTTTGDLADRYDDLSAALATDPDSIGALNGEITELSLGRDDVALELGLDACVRGGR